MSKSVAAHRHYGGPPARPDITFEVGTLLPRAEDRGRRPRPARRLTGSAWRPRGASGRCRRARATRGRRSRQAGRARRVSPTGSADSPARTRWCRPLHCRRCARAESCISLRRANRLRHRVCQVVHVQVPIGRSLDAVLTRGHGPTQGGQGNRTIRRRRARTTRPSPTPQRHRTRHGPSCRAGSG